MLGEGGDKRLGGVRRGVIRDWGVLGEGGDKRVGVLGERGHRSVMCIVRKKE